MNEKGFVPFSAAGAIIVIVIIAVVAQAEFFRHQESLGIAYDSSLSFLVTTAAEIHGNLQLIAKRAVYQALWEVSKVASDYPENRLQEIEIRATKYFHTLISEIKFSEHDARIELIVPEEAERSLVKISEAAGGFVHATVSLPKEARIKITTWDSNAKISIPFDNVDLLVDSRYFLLARKMDEFVKKKGNLIGLWTTLEYSKVLTDLILSKKVVLDRSKTKTAFEAAWAIQELETFGSTDYWATVFTEILTGIDSSAGRGDNFGILCRENIYELLPPAPLKEIPGISVYRDLRSKDIIFQRQDPAGLMGLPTATPIPLGTSGATVWWGQWEITLETEEEPIEEIFDFDYPTIPVIYGSFCAHLPLAYRWVFSEKKFTTVITIVSPEPFLIIVL
ncbi:hypothetical protein [Candidatus Hadarchaeum sp.]|uniref:hypothetical protein n=1 Tax=Candidatus Hadarchaeum sp. TaxID=2883567 RepID=UPI00319DF61F